MDERPALSKAIIEEASTILDSYFSYDHILVTNPETITFAEIDVVQRLQTWTMQAQSSIMGLFGPASISALSSSQLIASNYIRAPRASGIACLSYFCELADTEPPKGRLRETIGAVSLTYALIKQTVQHLPDSWPSKHQAAPDELLSKLDGTLRTKAIALRLLEELIEIAKPPLLLIVVHGFEMLEHEVTIGYLQALLEVFRTIVRRVEDPQQVVKVLFTTCGVSHVLSSGFSTDEIMDNSHGDAARSPGHARKGRQELSGVSFPDS